MSNFGLDPSARNRPRVNPVALAARSQGMSMFGEFESLEFFRRWAEECPQYMTLIERLPEGDIYSYNEFCVAIWLVVGSGSVVVAYQCREGPAEIAGRVQAWYRHLEGGIVPKRDRRALGHPVYGARRNPGNGEVNTVWFIPGDWMGVAAHLPLPEHRDQLPIGWSEVNRKRLEGLLLERPGG